MKKYYDRYKFLRVDGVVKNVPFIEIPYSSNDILLTYNKRSMRLDSLSYKYYGDEDYGWLILKANPQIGCYEFDIEDGAIIRIPYPLSDALNRYENEIQKAIEP